MHFFATYSRHVKFCTALKLDGTKIPTLIEILEVIKTMYAVRGFLVTAVAADNAFEPMRLNPDFILLKNLLNIASKDEHKPYIERFNRTLK